MQPHTSPLERAFELARSGRYRNTTDVKKALQSEGYQVETLTGATLLRQLRSIMADTAGKQAEEKTP